MFLLHTKWMLMLIIITIFTLKGVAGTYPISQQSDITFQDLYPLPRGTHHPFALTPRRLHECGGQNCCPGWTRTGESRHCITPICRGCGYGACTAPNLCTCPDGSVQPSCHTGGTDGLVARHALPDQLSTCDDLGCEQECVQIHGIPQCTCISGFVIDIDGRTCNDVDECLDRGYNYCYQGCINTVGSFMCTCFRGFTLADNGRFCRRLHDYRSSPCAQGSQTLGRPCRSFPVDAMTSIVRQPQLDPCGSDIKPCESPQVEFKSQSPCGQGLSPCIPNIQDVSFSTEHLPPTPCGSGSQPCSPLVPCGTGNEPCGRIPNTPTFAEEFVPVKKCISSDCNPPFPHDSTNNYQTSISQNEHFDSPLEPCISGPCPIAPEEPYGRILPIEPKIQNPCSACVPSYQSPALDTDLSGIAPQVLPPNVPTFPEVRQGSLPCSQPGCQTEYEKQGAFEIFHDIQNEPKRKPSESTRNDRQLAQLAKEVIEVTESSQSYQLTTSVIPIINTKTVVLESSQMKFQQSDQSSEGKENGRRKKNGNRKKRRRKKNKRKLKKKITRGNNQINRKTTDSERDQRITTPASNLVEHDSMTPTVDYSTLPRDTQEKSRFGDKIKIFLKEFNRLRGRGRDSFNLSEQGKGVKRRKQKRRIKERICRDDLCTSYINPIQTAHEAVTPDVCPPGYHRNVRGSVVHCEPAQGENKSNSYPVTHTSISNDTLSSTSGTSSYSIQSAGHISPTPPYVNMSPTESLSTAVHCAIDQIVVHIPGGSICQDKPNATIPPPTCPPGQTVTRSRMGYVCAAEGELRPICENGFALTLVMGRFVCEELSLSLSRCPEGLDSVDTPVGRICQYTGKGTTPTPVCPPGRLQVRSGNEYICRTINSTKTSARNCSPGYIVLDTTNGQKCIKNPSVQLGSVTCPDGFQLLDGECQSIAMSGDRSTLPCPVGQYAVMTDNGMVCQYHVTGNHGNNAVHGKHHERVLAPRVSQNSNVRGNVNRRRDQLKTTTDSHMNSRNNDRDFDTKCPYGQILTQKRSGFFCERTTVDVTEWICSPGEVIAQLNPELACVKYIQTKIVCKDDLELRLSVDNHEFSCLHPSSSHPVILTSVTEGPTIAYTPFSRTDSLPCGIGEIQIIDDLGSRCVFIEDHEWLCGDGYIVQTLGNGQKVCKSRTMKLKCPAGYELVLSSQPPECVPIGGSTAAMSPCEDTYSLSDDGGDVRCVLSSPGTDCSDDGMSYDCGRSLESLGMPCNPQCSNGGVCKHGACVCPPGVTGVACHQDVDECLGLPRDHCQYHCMNTFGSYHCVCPPGRAVNSDGRTCSDVECTPECLNGGHCRAGSCYCAAGFEGEFCQTDIDECVRHSGLCEHHCRNTHGGYACVCSPGSRLRLDGRTCTNTTCVPECRNGGVCVQHKCRCPPGYQGITCQLDVNECSQYPCSHLCTNIRGSYVCTCPPGFQLETDRHTCLNSTVTVP
ncbi:fibrillin-1-like [Argopecten irradians]|uniref:fibrillin-1-like n=1 Tax=Argopecten irradians TaxID=31199 RepID=UPI00371A77BD